MTFDSFMTKVYREFPDAYVGEDNDGQLIIYTGYKDYGDDVRKMDDE